MFDALRRFVRPSVTQHAPAVKMPIMNIDRSHSCDVEYRQITLWRQSNERAVRHKIARLYGKNACATILMSIMSRDKRRNILFVVFRTRGMKCCILFPLKSDCPRNEYSAPGVYRSECQLAPHPGVPQPLNSDRQSTRGLCPNTGRLHIWQRGKLSPSR